MKKVSGSVAETNKMAKEFGQKIMNLNWPKAVVVGLDGDLGSGKTTFTKALAKSLGIKQRVFSPTFVLMKRYQIKNKNLIHIDAYRFEKAKDVEILGWKETINNPDNIVLVEWAGNIKKAFPKRKIWVKLEHLDRKKRAIDIKYIK